MALAFAPAGQPAQREPNGAPTQMYHPGNTTIITTGAASVNAALPVDGNGNAYQALYVVCTQACWIAFATTSGDAVVAATTPAILVNPGAPLLLAVPPGTAGKPGTSAAGFVAAIQAAVAGSVCFIGVY